MAALLVERGSDWQCTAPGSGSPVFPCSCRRVKLAEEDPGSDGACGFNACPIESASAGRKRVAVVRYPRATQPQPLSKVPLLFSTCLKTERAGRLSRSRRRYRGTTISQKKREECQNIGLCFSQAALWSTQATTSQRTRRSSWCFVGRPLSAAIVPPLFVVEAADTPMTFSSTTVHSRSHKAHYSNLNAARVVRSACLDASPDAKLTRKPRRRSL
jgi:hypothetical protein